MSAKFLVKKWPSKGLLIDALKYGDDPERKFRINLTMCHHKVGLWVVVVSDIEVTGYERLVGLSRGWVKLALYLHVDVDYGRHSIERGEASCTLPIHDRSEEGTAVFQFTVVRP